MKLSPERVSFLARQMTERLKEAKGIQVHARSTQITAGIIRSLREVLAEDEKIEEEVREKIRSLSRPIPEGSDEWTILFRQYYDEERKKRGGGEIKRP